MPVLVDGREVPPVFVDHFVVLLRYVPAKHVIHHFLRYPGRRDGLTDFVNIYVNFRGA